MAGSYMEAVFERAEKQFVSEDRIMDWLNSFERPERGATDYTRDAVTVRNELISSIATRGEAERIDVTNLENLDILRDLLNEEESRVGRSKETETILKSQIKIVERVEVEEVARQEAIRTEQIAKEQLISEWKEAETIEEELEARRLLKAELPYSLRSAKGWRTKEGLAAFRMVMG
jgi:hypothetical protein